MSEFYFEDIVLPQNGFLRGPFGGDLKKEIFVPKTNDTYKVYEQGVVLQKNVKIGKYYISKKYFDEKMHRFEVKPKDFLVSCSGVNYGAIYQLNDSIERGIINQALLRIRLNGEYVDDNYFYYLFQHHIINMIVGRKGDSTIPNFPPLSVIKKIRFDLPELKIQSAVGKILNKIDAKIELNNRINTELESMAKTLYDYWFVQFDFPDEKGKPYKSSGGKMVYNEELKREIPKGWGAGVVGDLIELKYGKGLKKEMRSGSGFPVVGSNGIVDYHAEYIVNGPGIVIGRKGTLGSTIYLFENFYPIDTTYYVKPIPKIGFNFLYYFLNMINFKEMNSDSAVPGLSRNIALNVKVCLPSIKVIKQYEKITDSFFEKKANNQKQNQHLTQLRDWLLPMLMNGQVSVK